MMMKRLKIIIISLLFFLSLFPSFFLFGQEKDHLFTLQVPIDYSNPKLGKTSVSYELAQPFDKNRATVFIIADAQQFYVRKGAVKNLQNTLLDSTFNVVALISRANNIDLKKMTLDKEGNIDWQKAYSIFSWPQYVNDINEVRKKLVGYSGKINLLGQSGGGFLIHQFLSVYGQYVDKAFTAAAVNYHIDASLGINHDKFWDETSASIPGFSVKIKQLIRQGNIDRAKMAMLFQRQNFFVSPDSLTVARERLLNTLIANDTILIRQYQELYQINSIQQYYASVEGVPIKVRLFEFVFPLLNNIQISEDVFLPDVENLFFASQPLLSLYQEHKVQPKVMKFRYLHNIKIQVFVLAGRWDHTADYRSQIALANSYPNHILFIADDNHTFIKLKESGQYQNLILMFFKSNYSDDIQKRIAQSLIKFRWTEH